MPHAGGQKTGTIRIGVFVTGVVQGVGFRPFVYQQAVSAGLDGHVLNNPQGVEIEVEGPLAHIEAFIDAIRREAPPLSRITSLKTRKIKATGERGGFRIRESLGGGGHQLVSPDSCTCDDCLEEIFDPDDRRYRYPFTNCTNCGPRFTIIEALPYDRPLTTMRKFNMCATCREEYEDPGDRRFHAQPNACPDCGPNLWFADAAGNSIVTDDPLEAAASALRDGFIVAMKGLGGYQLACLAGDGAAVSRLRSRKRRPHKPFALMFMDTDAAALHCRISQAERALLQSPQRPIVLLERHLPETGPGESDTCNAGDSGIADNVAPGLDLLGVMLPCTPMHFLLMDAVEQPLVMTSGNLSEEPICRTNTDASSRLSGIADYFLMHNRGIRSTYDDSVLVVEDEQPVMIRRARGYAPLPVKLPQAAMERHPSGEPSVLATGADLKNGFCLTSGDEAFISQHIGDLENAETLLHLEQTQSLYERLFDTEPQRFACDRHPGYLSTAFCLERSAEPLKVQHHKAHIASCLCDNQCLDEVVGLAFDGTGFGDDGHIWGGEFFTGGLAGGFERAAHLDYFPLLGGEAAIHEPWRTALALAWRYAPQDLEFVADRFEVNDQRLQLLTRQLEAGLNCPLTSSCGRLFDAVASLVCGRTSISYEAQAAMELEALATRELETRAGACTDLDAISCRFSLERGEQPWVLSPARAVSQVIAGVGNRIRPGQLALSFHQGLADGMVRTAAGLADDQELTAAALSGGVFQNRLLLRLVKAGLRSRGIRVLVHGQVPPNDGGIALGQAVIALFES